MTRPAAAAKRFFDVTTAAVALVLASPLLIAVACAVRMALGRPILFQQTRAGQQGEPFVIYKFRTMRPATDAFPEGADDAERLTAFGRFLRASSLDELPEIVNVLRGDMSWVGPRPLLMDYLDRYTAEQARRHEVPPGITGLAQVSGRNQLSWEQKFKLDVYYVDRWSVWLDMRILLRTLGQTITRRGIRADGHATAPAFRAAVSEPSRGERR